MFCSKSQKMYLAKRKYTKVYPPKNKRRKIRFTTVNWLITDIICIFLALFLLLHYSEIDQYWNVRNWVIVFSAKSAIFQLYHGWNKLIFNEMMMRSTLYQTNTPTWTLIMLAYWNNSPRIDMMPHSDTLSRFQSNSYLLSLLMRA